MSRLQSYTENLLVEKVSRTDIDTALKNKNILIGCEFEYISYEIDEISTTDEDNYNAAYKAWSKYRTALLDFGKESDDINDQISETEDKIEKAEEKISEYEDELTDIEEDDDLIDTTKNRKIEDKKRFIKRAEDFLRGLRDKLESYEDDRDNIEVDSVDLDPYINYMRDYTGEDPTKDFDAIIWALEDRGNDRRFLIEPEESWSEQENAGTIEDIDFSDAPFRNYEIGSYGEVTQRVGSDKWAIETDSSLGDEGIEIKSPPTPLPDALKQIEGMFDWIEDGRGTTDNRCGFHVHMSIKGVSDLSKVIDPVKLILFMDEGYIWNIFPDRKANTYVTSVKDKLKSEGDISKIEWSKMADMNKAKSNMFSNHFDAISFRDMSSGHVEFRYMGSNNYSKKFRDVKTIIGQYAHNFALACDETYKRKEYFLKLQRIFNKIDMLKLRWERELIQMILLTQKSKLYANQETLLTKRLKEITISLSNLPYDLDNDTITRIMKNQTFVQDVTKELTLKINGLIKNDVVTDIISRMGMTMATGSKK